MPEIIRGVDMKEDSFVGSTSYPPRDQAVFPSVTQQPYAPFPMNPFPHQASTPPPQINTKQPIKEQRTTVLGGTVLGGTVLGGTVLGGTVLGGTVLGGTVLGGTVLGGTVLGSLYLRTRENFILKVYSILTVQLIITAVFCAAAIYSLDFLEFQYVNSWLTWVALSLMLATEIIIFVCPAGRMRPANLILLLLFTLSMSYFVSYFCGIIALQSGTNLVLMAALMTLGLLGILTIFAIIFPVEESIWGGVAVVTVFSFILFGIFCGVGWCSTLTNLYCALGVIAAGIFILIDSASLLGNSHFELSTDDYVVGALSLYIGIIKLFIYILSLMGKKRR